MTAGTHGSTFGGNPLAVAVGNAVLDIMLQPHFLLQVREMGLLFKKRLADIASRHKNVIAEVRGEGLMLGLKCNVPNTDLAGVLFAEKMLTVTAGNNSVRLLPPLIVTEAEINEACEKIDAACARLDATFPA